MTDRVLICTDLDRTLLPNGAEPESAGARERFHAVVDRPEVELAFAERRTGALAGAASQVIFSWPARMDDEGLRPSPLISGIPAACAPGRSPAGSDSSREGTTLHNIGGNGKNENRSVNLELDFLRQS